MAIFREIDENGYYIGDVNLHRNFNPKRYIEQNWEGQSLHKPRWSSTQKMWYEGMDKAELAKKLAINVLKHKITKAEILIKKIPSVKIKYGEIRRVQLVEYIRKIKKQIQELK